MERLIQMCGFTIRGCSDGEVSATAHRNKVEPADDFSWSRNMSGLAEKATLFWSFVQSWLSVTKLNQESALMVG